MEAAYILPLFLGLFLLLITTAFYFHDKAILYVTAYETAVVGAQKDRLGDTFSEEELEQHFRQRVEGKLLFFSGLEVEASRQGETVTVEALGCKGRWQTRAEGRARRMGTEEKLYTRDLLLGGSHD